MTLLTKQQILDADDRKTVDVDVPEWGGAVRLQVMSAETRARMNLAVFNAKKDNDEDVMVLMKTATVAHSIVDETGSLMFTTDELKAKSYVPIDRLFDAANDLSKITPDKVDEIAKN